MKIAKQLLPPLLALGALSACGKSPPPATLGAAPVPRADAESVLKLLLDGNERAARKQLATLVRRTPNDPRLQLLDASIRHDPIELLGPNSYAYTARAGDTYVDLAARRLGNPLKAYQLARYNHAKLPATLAAGDVVRIPGEAPRPPSPKPAAEPAPSRSPATKPRASAKASVAAPTAARASADPAAAGRSRAAGLAALNRGDVARATALLRRARALDPGNATIARDLARAERIALAVRARR